ncbi:probable UDP-3-O-acyl-N-acetylglucosamine deacetylase 1, mitochondrial isoform X2 [Tripterygium wilfordii]|uniref:probable UDP-3-O-acyl-N-acetylglucosamine deacetylase 1, mitochondrial isoform X2 n=1 Tax=Tripterygium wilfordii TaxID=458696 RepID=UPI0018F81B89|nr:probable UDP-3-O-acyl-N-acetylglucosamine deacetylase 1, mitochondrial isoform X2 [Tripterygium wilfordii]
MTIPPKCQSFFTGKSWLPCKLQLRSDRSMAAFSAVKSSRLISWRSTGRLQQTLAGCVELSGKTLHSGKICEVKIWPEFAGCGRYFDFQSKLVPASVDFAEESPLCTTLCKDGFRVRTVEHLLSALEAKGVDNCRIEIKSLDSEVGDVEVPILDGSAGKWVEVIEQMGLKVAVDQSGNSCDKLAPYLNEPMHVWRNDSFVAAFPSPKVLISYGIDFPQVERMHDAGLIKGGSLENAIVCSVSKGWLNPPLRFPDEPCRHKVLDLIGDLSLSATSGSQGFPVAHIVAYKAGHALNAAFARLIK